MNLWLLAPVAVAVWWFTRSASARPAGAAKKAPDELLLRAARAALAQGDPAQLRAVAQRARRQGHDDLASDLESVADEIERELRHVPPPAAAAPAPAAPKAPEAQASDAGRGDAGRGDAGDGVPRAVRRKVPGRGTVVELEPVTVTARRPTDAEMAAEAGQLALMLRTTRPGAENTEQVRRFQERNGLSKTDGKYGPATARVLGERYGIVPPTPRYWPRANTERVKADYRAWLRRMADRDAPRREEWLAAARAV